MEGVTLLPVGDLPADGLDRLVAVADAEGVANVAMLRAALVVEGRRFDGPGEVMLVAVTPDGGIVGTGGMSPCHTRPGAVRMRRFYVHPDWRRRGLARLLATVVMEHGFQAAPLLTCNAGATPVAPPFWEALGFEAVDDDGITHVRWRDDR